MSQQQAPAKEPVKKEPEVRSQARQVKPHPTRAAVVSAKKVEAKEIKPVKTDLAPGIHYNVGYVSEKGILFPKGYIFKGGSVSWKGNVVLNICPKCRTELPPTEAVKGVCTNQECNFNKVEELEDFKL